MFDSSNVEFLNELVFYVEELLYYYFKSAIFIGQRDPEPFGRDSLVFKCNQNIVLFDADESERCIISYNGKELQLNKVCIKIDDRKNVYKFCRNTTIKDEKELLINIIASLNFAIKNDKELPT